MKIHIEDPVDLGVRVNNMARVKGKYEAKVTFDFDFDENESDIPFEGCRKQVTEELTKWIREELELLLDDNKSTVTVEELMAELRLEDEAGEVIDGEKESN